MKLFDLLSQWNKWFVFVPTAIGIVTLCYRLWIFGVSVKKYFSLKDLKTGLYYGYWIDPVKKIVNCEILMLRKRITGIKIVPIYKHAAAHNYKLKMSSLGVDKWVLRGYWRNINSNLYQGGAMFRYNDAAQSLEGKWLGPKSNHEINGGEWIFPYSSNRNTPYFRYLRFKRFNTFKEKLFPRASMIDNIITRHLEFKSDNCTVENVVLGINKDSFIPALGKISIPLIKYAATVVKSSDKVLDIGTGTGFYPIFLAKNIGCQVKGIDINESIITLATANARHNKVQDLTTFDITNPNKLYDGMRLDEKYDVIVANLPFSQVRNVYRSKNSIFYHSFAGSRDLLEQFILGSQYHITPNGKLIFCYGESGYMDFLQSVINVSSWGPLKIMDKIKEADDTFYICQLELKDKVKSYYSELYKVQTKVDAGEQGIDPVIT